MIKQLFRQLKGGLFGKEPKLPDEVHPLTDLELLELEGNTREITLEQYEDLVNSYRDAVSVDSTEKDE